MRAGARSAIAMRFFHFGGDRILCLQYKAVYFSIIRKTFGLKCYSN